MEGDTDWRWKRNPETETAAANDPIWLELETSQLRNSIRSQRWKCELSWTDEETRATCLSVSRLQCHHAILSKNKHQGAAKEAFAGVAQS